MTNLFEQASTNLVGKNVLISGGSRGIGLETTRAFAALGANVAIIYGHNQDAAQSAIKEADGFKVKATAFEGSVADEVTWEKASAFVAREWGSLDVVVASAGIWNANAIPIDNMASVDYDEMLATNMRSTFLASKYAALYMKPKRSGSIVIISSTAGQRGESEHSHYAASKGAQISFAKSLATELASWNIRVNCVAPGWVKTDMTASTLNDPRSAAQVKSQIPLGRAADPSEIASAILFLASPMASFITGEILNVNGGAVLCG